MGHMARCRRLAFKFKKNGNKVVFVLDQVNKFSKFFLSGFIAYEIYSKDLSFINESQDARIFLKCIDVKNTSCVIVDDYRLSAVWEKIVHTYVNPIIVLDDQNINKHYCSLLIDSTWEGGQTYERYESLTSNNTIRLLGPKYLILDEEFEAKDAAIQNHVKQKNQIRLLLTLGGGGDLSVLISIAKFLINNNLSKITFLISIVAGPYANNKSKLISFSDKHDNVEVIQNQDGLFKNLNETDLYVGSSGGTLFEALSLNIPALTFSISDNQQNNFENFENFGHYFHIDSLESEEISTFSELIIVMAQQYERVKALYHKPSFIKIDGGGAARVYRAIQKVVQKSFIKGLEVADSDIKDNINAESSLSPIDDSYINRYLFARNFEKNLEKMIEIDKIPQLNHYLWWFQHNKRDSYVFKRNGESLLFIWHQPKKIRNTHVITSGWFVASDNCTGLDALNAINKHSAIIDNLFPGYYWVIVIHRKNIFMQKFHQRSGFKDVKKDSAIEVIIQDSFSGVSTTDFIYYQRLIERRE